MNLRVLVFAPTGRDGLLICNLLVSKGIACVSLPTAEMARIELKVGAGVVVMAEEGLTLSDIAEWAAQISEQPSWSDFPLILLTASGGGRPGESKEKALLGSLSETSYCWSGRFGPRRSSAQSRLRFAAVSDNTRCGIFSMQAE